MPSFGENLRREREKRNITLDQISQSTKISTRMLRALEEDKFNQLPGGIFNKGFVRAYARCVGLDEDQAVADYLEASGERPPVQPEVPVEEPAPRIEAGPESSERQLPWGMFAALLLLAALALSLWSHRQKNREATTAVPSARPLATQPVAESAPPSGAASGPSAENLTLPASVPATATPSQRIQPTSAASTTPGSATAQLATATAPGAGGFVIVVQARADSWTTIISDGTTVYSGNLEAGDQRAVRGYKEVVVKAGNAGGVDLFFNGTKIERPGNYGEVRTITFGPGGLTSNPAPAPPAQ